MQEFEENQYKIYITDALRLITENTAKISNGRYINKRWIDIVNTKQEQKQYKSGDEIAMEFIKKAGLIV